MYAYLIDVVHPKHPITSLLGIKLNGQAFGRCVNFAHSDAVLCLWGRVWSPPRSKDTDIAIVPLSRCRNISILPLWQNELYMSTNLISKGI